MSAIPHKETVKREKKDEDESSALSDTVAGLTRTLARMMGRYPRFKFFRPKLQPGYFEKFHTMGTAGVQAATSLGASPQSAPKSRLLPFAINMISGVALFHIYDSSRPEAAGVLDCAKSGALGGMVHGLIMHPCEMMLMQGLRSWRQLPASVGTLRPRVLLSLPLTVGRDSVGFGLFFGVYEGIRQLSGQTGIVGTAGAGVAAAAAHHLVTYPSYAVRDLLGADALRAPPKKIVEILSQHRMRLFDGYGRSLLRALPGGALTFVVYEALLTPLEAQASNQR